MGGDFIIDSMGIVRLDNRSKETADRPSVSKLLEIIKQIK
jgi:hypothetical protein